MTCVTCWTSVSAHNDHFSALAIDVLSDHKRCLWVWILLMSYLIDVLACADKYLPPQVPNGNN